MARIADMGLFFVLAMACITMGPRMSAGQAAPAPAPECTSELVQLLPCLSFLTNSSVSTVVPTCCSGLSNVSSSSPICLCELISPANANQSAGLGINDTRALELPGLCSLSLSVSSCSAVLGPALAPSPVALVPAPVAFTPAPSTPVPAISPASFLAPAPAPGAASPSPSIAPVSSPLSSASPGPSADCSSVTTELASCVNFLTDTSSSPSATCCKNLGEVVDTSPACLCQLVENSAQLAGALNTTRITELPSLCSISVSISNCTGATGSPIGSAGPGGAPSGNDAKRAASTSLFVVISLCLATIAHALLQ